MAQSPDFPVRINLPGVAFACLAIVALLASQASAIVILNTNGSANNGQTSAAGTGAPYDNVGVRGSGGASVVYLGNDWALTANHVAVIPGDPNYGYVQIYEPGMNSYVNATVDKTQQIFNSNGSPTDLNLVHLTSNPGLPAVQIAGSYPTSGQAVTLVGAGMNLGTEQSYSFLGLNYSGYNLTSSEGLPRWGTNDVTSGSIGHSITDIGLQNSSGQEEYEYTFSTTFGNYPTSTNEEAQATNGDSGGGVFEQIGGTWYLLGMIDGLSNYPFGSGSSDYENNVFVASSSFGGERSVVADLAPYESMIAAVVPEPSSLLLALSGAAMALLAGIRRRYRGSASH